MNGSVIVGPGQGDARHVLGSIDTVKLQSTQTGGRLAAIEWEEPNGGGPPLHVHTKEDEAYYVLSGEVTFFIGEETIEAPAGTLIFAPRGIAHSWTVQSDR